jgi:hypothetical protein
MNVGRVVRLETQDDLSLGGAEWIIENSGRLDELAEATQDERMSPERWRMALNVELLMLLKWSTTRHLAAARGVSGPGLIGGGNEVLILLPSYGYALHALRRAVPFAALGLRTVVSVPPECARYAAAPIIRLVRALGLDATLSLSDQPPPRLVADYTMSQRPIFVTGRLATWRRLRRQYPDACIYGATGTCSIVVSTDANLAKTLETTLRQHKLPTSCSNHGLTLVCDAYPEAVDAVACNGGSLTTAGTVRRIVRQIQSAHPSVILAIETGKARETIPTDIAGYQVFACDPDGIPDSLEGFARDPVCGWPGDYCV